MNVLSDIGHTTRVQQHRIQQQPQQQQQQQSTQHKNAKVIDGFHPQNEFTPSHMIDSKPVSFIFLFLGFISNFAYLSI